MAVTKLAVLSVTPFEIKWLLNDDQGTDTTTLPMTNAQILADLILVGLNQPVPGSNPVTFGTGTDVVPAAAPRDFSLAGSPLRKAWARGSDAQIAAIPTPPPSGGGGLFVVTGAISAQDMARAALLQGPVDVFFTARAIGGGALGEGVSQWSADVTVAAGQPELLITAATGDIIAPTDQQMIMTMRLRHTIGR